MKLLLLAPHPFYQNRGTPIAVRLLASTLGRHGYEIDLLTFHEGAAVELSNCRIIRTRTLSWITNIKPGFSFKKIACDVLLFFKTVSLLRQNRYDAIHAVEEAVFIARFMRLWFGVPYIYDMDSSLAEQLLEKYPLLRPLGVILRFFEQGAVKKSSGVIAVCRILEERARQLAPGKPVLRLEDVPMVREEPAAGEVLREKYAITGPIIMYVGNLEHYQGMDLLLNSLQILAASHPEASLVVIGGSSVDISASAGFAAKLGIGQRVHFIGPRPLEQLFGYLVQADILVSPRSKGTNTPMKIYSYLDSGVAVLATDLPTHTQVLDDQIALLVAAEPEAMAAGLALLLADSHLRTDLARRARERVSREYSREAYEKKLCAFYDGLALD